MKRICVIGSFNIDMAAQAACLPQAGETILMDSFDLFVGGGKGANQAVAAAKLGADVRMTGLLGDKFFGEQYLSVLDRCGVKRDGTVGLLAGEYPGIAYVAVDQNGSNMLFVYSGSNLKVTPDYIDSCWTAISECDIFLLQQEIPQQTNLHLMRRLRALEGKTIILDPAPAKGFTAELLQYCDVITPNETEMAAISGMEISTDADCRAACEKLRTMGADTVIFKAGKNGAYLYHGEAFTHIPAYAVSVVDTTAAGDSFNAGLSCGLAAGLSVGDSVRFGHAVAGISTTKLGAQTAMPDMAALLAFLDENDSELAQKLRENWR